MNARVTLATADQLALPKETREAHNWQAGQEFVLIAKGAGVLVMPVPARDELEGIAAGADHRDHRDRSDRT